jgi:hypothetical protein
MSVASNRKEKTDNKRNYRLLILLAIPSIVFSLALLLSDIKGPYYLAKNSDPEYAYLFNSLNIAKFEAPTHTDHPGTSLQLLGAVVIRASYFFSGKTSLVEDVLSRPEHYLRIMNILLILLYSITLFAVGLKGYRVSGTLIVALILQISPFLFITIFDSLTRVYPETLLISLCNVVIIILLDQVYPYSEEKTSKDALWLGVTVGIGIVTKITFAPVFLLCMFFLYTWSSRLLFLLSTILSGFLFLLPAIGSLKRIGLWIVALLTHKGYYGVGQSGFIDLSVAGGFLTECFQNEPIFSIVFIPLTVITIYSLTKGNKTNRNIQSQLIGFCLFNWVMLVMVAKHPRIHYILPGLALIILNIIIVINTLKVSNNPSVRKTIFATFIVLFLFLSYFQGRHGIRMAEQKGNSARLQLDAAHFADLFTEKDLYIISSYRSSNQMFALYFGNGFSGRLYADKLYEMYPNAVFYSVWGNNLYGFKHRLSLKSLKENITKYVIQGSYLFSETRYSPSPPPGMRYFTIKKFGDEGFYRLINKEVLAPEYLRK